GPGNPETSPGVSRTDDRRSHRRSPPPPVTPPVILPGATIGIIGGGQLGRMLILEARRMDYRTIVLDPDPGAPAAQVSDHHIVAPLTDLAAARELATRSDVVTLEWENADLAAVRFLSDFIPVRPGAR